VSGTDDWMREHIFGCGAYPEDQIPPVNGTFMPPPSYESAQALRNAGKTAEAIRAYHQVLAIDPNDTRALDDLAWIRATSPNSMFRDPAEAELLAKRLVDLTHYKFRRSTGGLYAKAYKIHASHTLAAAFAANGNFTRAVQYAMQSLETVRRLLVVEPTPDAEQLLADAQEYLKVYQAGQPFVAPEGYRRTTVAMH